MESGDHIVDLLVLDDEWRAEGDAVTGDRSQDESVGLAASNHMLTDGTVVEGLRGLLIRDELHGCEQPPSADFAYERVVGKRLEACL